MLNNDVLRRVRYIFDLNDMRIQAIFAMADHAVTQDQISIWFKREDDRGFKEMKDRELAIFLNGFITARRGKKDGPKPEPENVLTNNLILWKLRIALNLKSNDLMQVMKLGEFPISEHELSALFRRPGHKHYRECKDQILRYFLVGLTKKYRPETAD